MSFVVEYLNDISKNRYRESRKRQSMQNGKIVPLGEWSALVVEYWSRN